MRKAAFIFLLIVLLASNLISAGAQGESVRLRIVHGVLDEPQIDIFANDAPIVESLGFVEASPFVTLTPGVVSLMVVAADEELELPILGPEVVTLEADHDYAVVVIGLVAESNLQLVVIDLTAAFEDVETPQGHADMLLVNALNGAEAISASADTLQQAEGLAFGEFVATSAPTTPYQHRIVVTEQATDVLFDQLVPAGLLPGTRNLLVLAGTYPGSFLETYGFSFVRDSSLNSIAFLQVLSDANIESIGTFETFLDAVERADLRDMLANEGPFIVAVPNDAAFAELEPGTLDDPAVLQDVMLYHITEELIEVVDESVTLTTLQGSSIEIVPGTLGVLVNNALLRTQLVGTRNGFVAIINEVLIPPED
jgi:hypothetical protein